MPDAERLTWTADLLAPSPSERILEVGCGHGVLLGLLAAQVSTGRVVGIDRSATMIVAATRRNRAAVEAGRVALSTTTLVDADLDDGPFDVVVAVNVRAFWTSPAPEWDVVDRVLAPGGRVLVAFSVMDGAGPDGIVERVRALAGERGFPQAVVHEAATRPFPSAAVELRRG